MKTTLNPRMNPTEFSMTLRSSCVSCDFSSSTPAPEISETYPGTSGSTQGDRNEMSPATNAAIGSGRADTLGIVPAQREHERKPGATRLLQEQMHRHR